MLGLPTSTILDKARPLPKKALFDKFKPDAAERQLFDEQIARLAIVAEISPQTVNLAAGTEVTAIYVIAVTLKTPNCDKRNIKLLSKLIDQRMLFVLQYEESTELAAYHSEQVLVSEKKLFDEWQFQLTGLDLGAVWENLIAQIAGFDLTDGKDLYQTITENKQREKLIKQIAMLEKKAWSEKQPRRKWEYATEIRQLKEQLEEYNTHE
jgi:hypothetical protein